MVRSRTGSSAAAIRQFLDLPEHPVRCEEWNDVVVQESPDYKLIGVDIKSPDGDSIPGFLVAPKSEGPVPGVLVHHQHNVEWHLGKSEVAGLAGNPLQWFGRDLAVAGVAVLVVDSVGFEDRRSTATGTERHADDSLEQERELAHRLVRGDTLARKVLSDFEVALSFLLSQELATIDHAGVFGHSYGGITAIFQAALDSRLDFACSSGAAFTYKRKLAESGGIDRFAVIPGVTKVFDLDDLACLIAPRPFYILGGEDDEHSRSMEEIADAAMEAFSAAGVPERFSWRQFEGGHAMTSDRHASIVEWLLNVTLGRHHE